MNDNDSVRGRKDSCRQQADIRGNLRMSKPRGRWFLSIRKKWLMRIHKYYAPSMFRGLGNCLFASQNSRSGMWAVTDTAASPKPYRRGAYKTLAQAVDRFVEVDIETMEEVPVGIGWLMYAQPMLSRGYLASIVFRDPSRRGEQWDENEPIAVMMYGGLPDKDEDTKVAVVLGTRKTTVVTYEFDEGCRKLSLNKGAEIIWHWLTAYEEGECFTTEEESLAYELTPPKHILDEAEGLLSK